MILYKTVYSTKSGAPRMWKKLLVTRWLQCFNVPSCSIMFNFVSRESPIPPTDFNERFVFLHGKVFTSIGSNSVVRVRCGGRYTVLMTNLHHWGDLHQIDTICFSCRSWDDIFFWCYFRKKQQTIAPNHLGKLYTSPSRSVRWFSVEITLSSRGLSLSIVK